MRNSRSVKVVQFASISTEVPALQTRSHCGCNGSASTVLTTRVDAFNHAGTRNDVTYMCAKNCERNARCGNSALDLFYSNIHRYSRIIREFANVLPQALLKVKIEQLVIKSLFSKTK